jgi:hypothetical protein
MLCAFVESATIVAMGRLAIRSRVAVPKDSGRIAQVLFRLG